MNGLDKLTKSELVNKCKELNISKYSSKNKPELIKLIQDSTSNKDCTNSTSINSLNETTVSTSPDTNENNIETINKNNIRFIDLFCGIGGFHQALNRIPNTSCVFASDIDEQCRKTYEQNYKVKPDGDISKIKTNSIPSFDVLCGGFPCQSFSNSGKKKGFEDKRGQLFEYILKIAQDKKPSFMFLENVKHIQKIENGKIFQHILNRIKETGYNATTVELSPHQLGIPQQRERVVFICIRNDIYNDNNKINLTIPNIPINLSQIIETDRTKTDKYKISKEEENILNVWDQMIKQFETGENLSPTILCNEFNRTYTEDEFKSLPSWKQEYITKNKPIYNKYKPLWDKWLEENKTILSKKEIYGKLEWQVGKKEENDTIFNHFIQLRQSGIRVKRSKYFPTLVAIVQTPIYAKEKRYITPRECARLQSFPDDFILNENDKIAYKQFGNAVNVDVVHFVILNTLKAYNIV
jgi:DNA (cytosine-5)-methyltransferase 1